MFQRISIPVWVGIFVLSGMFLMGQDTWPPSQTCVDNDGDGYGSPANALCMYPELDCEDMNIDVYPGAPELCDWVDNQCLGDVGYGVVDEECTAVDLLTDTGQDQCYDNTHAITCSSPGEPFYGQDAQFVTNPMSYTNNGDGTVTDNVTGLMWQQCNAHLSGPDCTVGVEELHSWAGARTYCAGLDLGGYTDWRLPDKYEGLGIVDYGRYDPAIDTTIFPRTRASDYWSSFTDAYPYSDRAWMVDFQEGLVFTSTKTGPGYVRCVRGESLPNTHSFTDNGDGTVTDNVTGLMWQQQGNQGNWESALAYCDDLVLAGRQDWRLPDVKELRSIVDDTRYQPSIDPTVFPGTVPNFYISSSTVNSGNPFAAWLVSFNYGYIYYDYKNYNHLVRCVR